ncbi:hypothetical protein CONPUDRAFT_160984 [Coniophora puteana RWD-64-598 SS2]|uniref:F-box domain-containing protein n=1 Tax=Coniophora puteana (strain RWD-64-598) TaxID=741705 RepID=A0A5M3N407_CONPW|nr:uncharacterized protein CONPUDRAFT_160984 [Coniophora puteana RWD-64-598 SS2]EIW86160.1 hypothetical protein CONPUDRAFT_160984 [Coniophora puteana RWD-64-598 SS2]
MHQALTLYELLQAIFNQLGDSTEFFTDRSERKRTLASLARTCKAFTKPAIEELWYMMDAVGLFQNLIPHRLIMTPTGPTSDPHGWTVISQKETWIVSICLMSVYHLLTIRSVKNAPQHDIRALSTAEQARLMFYTSSIQRLSLPSFLSGLPIAAPALRMLLSLPGGLERAFPKLREVYILDKFPAAQASYEPFMQHAKSLNFQPTDSTGRASLLSPSISQIIRRLGRLQSMSCTHIDQPTLLHLSQLPCLTYLSFDTGLNISSATELMFPALRSLRLTSKRFKPIIFFLKRLARFPSSLHVLTLEQAPTLSESEQLFAVISKHPTTDLQSLSAMYFEGNSDDPGASMTFDTIVPLLRFSNMRVFNWYFSSRIDLTDLDIILIAHAWPKIRRLSVCSSVDDYTHKPRIESLFAMAKQCPYLEHLELPVDIAKFDRVPLGDPADGFAHSQLRRLHLTCVVSCADEDAIVTLTIILAQVFPRLRSVTGVMVEESLRQGGAGAGSMCADSYVSSALGALGRARVDGGIQSWVGEGVRRMVREAFKRELRRMDSSARSTFAW